MDAVQNAVQNGVEQLSKSNVNVNADPADPYRFNARTKDELNRDAALAANTGQTDPRKRFSQLKDPAVEQLGSPEWDPEVDDGPPFPKAPPGARAPQPAPSPNGQRSSGGPVPWLL
jgi:hypothetical protein